MTRVQQAAPAPESEYDAEFLAMVRAAFPGVVISPSPGLTCITPFSEGIRKVKRDGQ